MARKKTKETGREIEPAASPLLEGLWPRAFFNLNWPSRYDFDMRKMPIVDLVDEGDSFKITVDLPGIEKKDIKLNVNKDNIVISASAKKEKEEKGKDYYYNERSSTGYYRRISLPLNVDPESTKTKLENGSLEINVKKDKASGKYVKIE